MERRVEDRVLLEVGTTLTALRDERECGRLVQRCELGQSFELGDQLVVDERRAWMVATVDDSVDDDVDPVTSGERVVESNRYLGRAGRIDDGELQ